jgi:hypothetical protein
MNPRVFISYSRSDLALANRVRSALDSIGLNPWIDHIEISPGQSFLEKMNEGLREASYVLVLLSPASLNSRWVTREWMSALADEGTVLIPVIVADCEIPPLLRDILHIDLRKDVEQGLNTLKSFFNRELKPLTAVETTRAMQTTRLRNSSPRLLRLVALQCMQQKHLQGFLFDADMDPNAIEGDSVHSRITYMLITIKRDGLLEEFADWLESEPSCQRCVRRTFSQLSEEQGFNLSA